MTRSRSKEQERIQLPTSPTSATAPEYIYSVYSGNKRIREAFKRYMGSYDVETYGAFMGTKNNFQKIETAIVLAYRTQPDDSKGIICFGARTKSRRIWRREIYGLRSLQPGENIGSMLLTRLIAHIHQLQSLPCLIGVPPTGQCHRRILALHCYKKAGFVLCGDHGRSSFDQAFHQYHERRPHESPEEHEIRRRKFDDSHSYSVMDMEIKAHNIEEEKADPVTKGRKLKHRTKEAHTGNKNAQIDKSSKESDTQRAQAPLGMTKYEIQVQHRYCNDHQILLIELPENTPSPHKSWVFCRQIEFLIFDTTANLSNLLHDLEALELTGSVRHYKRVGDFGATEEQHKELMRLFNQFKKAIEPLSGPGKRCSLMPLEVACRVALSRGKKKLYLALRGEKAVPAETAAAR